jgi:hypothetical protein
MAIFTMLEFMGAWDWYQRQLQLAQRTVRTQGDKPVRRRGAATHVLDKLLGKSIRGVGRLVIGKGDNTSDVSPKNCDSSLIMRARLRKRKTLQSQLYRGEKLREKLVKELGYGILFSSEIWWVDDTECVTF